MNHVGRPSNEELKKRRNKKIIKILLPSFLVVFIVAAILIAINGGLSKLMGNSVVEWYCKDSTYKLDVNKKLCSKDEIKNPLIIGDIDNDGLVSQNDYTLLKNYLYNGTTFTSDQKAAADIDNNSNVTSVDYQILELYFNKNAVIGTYGKSYERIGRVTVCPSGYTKNSENKCKKTIYQNALSASKLDKVTSPIVSYSCPSGTVLNNKKCYAKEVVNAVLTQEYVCPKGTSPIKVNGTLQCNKFVQASKRVTYSYCPNGYTKIGNATCQKSTKAQQEWKCPNGYTRQGGNNMMATCKKVSNPTSKKTGSTYCPSGYTKVGGAICQKSIPAAVGYSCSSGYILKGSSSTAYWCEKYTNASKRTTYSYCPNGYTKVGGATCQKKVAASKIPSTNKYYCSKGKLSGKYCVQTTSLKYEYAYYCKSGTINNTNKTCKITKSANKTYKCGSGYKKSGNKCIQTTSLKYEYNKNYCATGKYSNGKCVDTKSVTLNITCPSGYKKSGNNCIQTANMKYEYAYYCNSGTLVGSSCKVATSASKTNTYKCPTGYTQQNKQCSKVGNLVDVAKITYKCPSGYKISGTDANPQCLIS